MHYYFYLYFGLILLSSLNLPVQKVQHELLTQYEQQLLEKEHSGCHALLRDDKVRFWKKLMAHVISMNKKEYLLIVLSLRWRICQGCIGYFVK